MNATEKRLADARLTEPAAPTLIRDGLVNDAVNKLDALTPSNPIEAHKDADATLCDLPRALDLAAVADAFERARNRCEFHYW